MLTRAIEIENHTMCTEKMTFALTAVAMRFDSSFALAIISNVRVEHNVWPGTKKEQNYNGVAIKYHFLIAP